MSSRIRKILKHTVIAVLSLAVLFLVLNLFLTGRLERYLKRELIERTANATDGFYRLSFDKLSISFFKGELRLEGISLEPDSKVFEHWAALDSLPDTYVSTRIEVIDFKGINLVWRWNYRQLHFNTFEIRSPEVRVYGSSGSNPLVSGLAADTVEHAESKTLYEVISPYIDALSVKTLNLENASISYNVENQVSPIIYTLNNVSFHAYGFMLDSTSSRSGKLLYCDNFDFVTNQPQTLLVNNDFRLETDSICLSTQDSIIYIQKIQLLPQELLWGETNRKPTNYLEGKVQTVEIQGIHFRREEALNYLSARNFEIQSSDIKVYDLTREKKQANADVDSLVQALSLYDVISPVLHSISVDQIRIERTALHYSLALKGQIEDFSIPEFNFHAEGLLIDSLVAPGEELNYFRSIAFEANDIQGIMRARNHRFDICRIKMHFFIKRSILIALQRLPVCQRLLPFLTCRSIFTAFDIFECHFIRCHHTATCTHFYTQVAQRQTSFHSQTANCFSGIFHKITGCTARCHFRHHIKSNIFCRHTFTQFSIHCDTHCLGACLQDTL